jgi:hypothetical protein
MDVCGTEDYRERDAFSVPNNLALRALLSLIRRIRTGSLAPLLAGMLAESKEALSQSISPASPSRSNSTRCRSSHTPASCQSRKRRQHVEPDPQPISLGSISHGMPLFSTKTMPVSAARSSTRGLPPLGLGGSSGNRGSMISQSLSLTSSLLMLMSLTSTHEQVLQGSLSTVLRTMDSPEQSHQPARKSQHEGEREGDGEEDVLVGDVGVEATIVGA